MKDAEGSTSGDNGETKAMPKVSVIIPTYNRARLLGACLESIACQTYRDFEIVVVDDGSTDNTAEVAFAPLAHYFWQENQGVPGALNRALREARGEYIRFVASDDVLLPGALEAGVQVLEENPSVGLVYAQAWEVNEKGMVTSLRKPGFAQGSYVRSGRKEVGRLLFWNHITCSTVMVRRRCFDDVGLFDPQLRVGEDWDMWVRIAKKYDLAYVDRPLARYLKHTGNISMSIDIEFLDYLRPRLIESVFDDPELGHLYQGLKGKAYFVYHHYIAAMAYKANRMGVARRRLLAAFKSRPGEALRLRGLMAFWLFLKTLIPVPMLEAARATVRVVRNHALARRHLVQAATGSSEPLSLFSQARREGRTMKDAEEDPLSSGGEPKVGPKVSVVIPTYNRAHLLGACLQSIARQTYRDFEIVVVDDGSTDNTAEVVAAFAPLARYFWQENQGIPGALNRGLREARGEYVSFLASDDALVSQTLEVEVQALEGNPGVGLVYGQAWQMNEKGTLTSLRKPGFAKGSYIRSGRDEIRHLLFADHITCSTVMVRKRCFDDVGLFDPKYSPLGEDWDMWTRIARRYDVAYIAKPLGIYLDHAGPEGNIYAKVDPWTLERLRLRYLKQVLQDPEIGHLYQDVKTKAFARHHSVVATRAYKAREMGLARSHIMRALRVRPQEFLGPKGLAMVWLFLKTWMPVPMLESVRGVKGVLKDLVLTRVGAKLGLVRCGAKQKEAPRLDEPQEGVSPAGMGHEGS